MSAAEGYEKLPEGVRCACFLLWQEADGTLWCCGKNRCAVGRILTFGEPCNTGRAECARPKLMRPDQVLDAVRDLVEAAEAAGWDTVSENGEALQRARDAYATLRAMLG